MVHGVEEHTINNTENSDRDNCVCNYYNGKYLKYIINKCTDSIAAFFNSSISFVREVSTISEVQ